MCELQGAFYRMVFEVFGVFGRDSYASVGFCRFHLPRRMDGDRMGFEVQPYGRAVGQNPSEIDSQTETIH